MYSVMTQHMVTMETTCRECSCGLWDWSMSSSNPERSRLVRVHVHLAKPWHLRVAVGLHPSMELWEAFLGLLVPNSMATTQGGSSLYSWNCKYWSYPVATCMGLYLLVPSHPACWAGICSEGAEFQWRDTAGMNASSSISAATWSCRSGGSGVFYLFLPWARSSLVELNSTESKVWVWIFDLNAVPLHPRAFHDESPRLQRAQAPGLAAQ